MDLCWGFLGGAHVAGWERGRAGPGGPLGSRFLVTVRLLPLGLDGEREAGHSSQRQVAQCKQLIVAEELL